MVRLWMKFKIENLVSQLNIWHVIKGSRVKLATLQCQTSAGGWARKLLTNLLCSVFAKRVGSDNMAILPILISIAVGNEIQIT